MSSFTFLMVDGQLTSFSRDKLDHYWGCYLVDKRAYWVSCLWCV